VPLPTVRFGVASASKDSAWAICAGMGTGYHSGSET